MKYNFLSLAEQTISALLHTYQVVWKEADELRTLKNFFNPSTLLKLRENAFALLRRLCCILTELTKSVPKVQ